MRYFYAIGLHGAKSKAPVEQVQLDLLGIGFPLLAGDMDRDECDHDGKRTLEIPECHRHIGFNLFSHFAQNHIPHFERRDLVLFGL